MSQNIKGHVTMALQPFRLLCHTYNVACHGQPMYYIRSS